MKKRIVKTKKRNPQLDLNKLNIESTKYHPILCKCFSYVFYKSAIKMRYLLNDQFLKHNLILPQLGLLMLLKELGPMSQVDLGMELDIDKTTMVKLIDDLEINKFVARTSSQTDRRINMLEITTMGLRKLEKASGVRLNFEKDFLSKLTSIEKKILIDSIAKLL
ncbi:MAG: MarR family transcriptional regulator [Bacteriovoracaceae bacterium]|nr:MarR family transcriptional regulator [Bacteriovoracaceae bacterium]